MNVTLFLADYACVSDGKLTAVGAGWSLRTPGPMVSAVAVHVQVPWDEANRKHDLKLELVDADGKAVTDPNGEPVRLAQTFEVGRPPGIKPGSFLDHLLALTIGGLPLEVGQYEWRLEIDGETRDDWRRPFSVVPQSPQALAA